MTNKWTIFSKVITLCFVLFTIIFLSSCNNNVRNYEKVGNDTLETAKTFSTSDKLTGFGGANMETDEMKTVQKELDEILKQGKMVTFVIINTKTLKGFSFNADRVCVGKSTIKAPYITSLLMNDSSIFEQDQSAIKKAITYSNNESYTYLRNKYGNDVFKDFCSEVNVDISKCNENFPKNMTVRDLAKMWAKMYPFILGNKNSNSNLREFVSYFKCTAYSPFSTLFWRDYDVYSKAGWDEGISVNDETGLLGKIPDANMIDGDPLNNEEAMNDTGIVCAPNGDYIFAYFSDFPAITDLMYPLILAINEAEIAM